MVIGEVWKQRFDLPFDQSNGRLLGRRIVTCKLNHASAANTPLHGCHNKLASSHHHGGLGHHTRRMQLNVIAPLAFKGYLLDP